MSEWVRVAHFIHGKGLDWVREAEYPNRDEWVLIEIESATGKIYEARRHQSGSWPSFGVRWQPIEEAKRCPACGYTEADRQFHGDHWRCSRYPFFPIEISRFEEAADPPTPLQEE